LIKHTAPRLIIPEYGRHVQRMVEHCMTMEDRAERTKVAKAIIAVIGRLSPHAAQQRGRRPHPVGPPLHHERFQAGRGRALSPCPRRNRWRPSPTGEVPQAKVRFGHYGKIVERFIDAAAEMKDGPDKDNAVIAIGNLMKRQFIAWNRDSVGDEVIIKDLKELSDGRLQAEGGRGAHQHERHPARPADRSAQRRELRPRWRSHRKAKNRNRSERTAKPR
jgi:hypothetical protein